MSHFNEFANQKGFLLNGGNKPKQLTFEENSKPTKKSKKGAEKIV